MYNLNLTRPYIKSNNMYCTVKIKIAFVILQIRKKKHGFKAMEGADSENSFHE